ncbi:hypothetical protein [uncultured Jatrophihabitans sp.]|uniref:hypothetical protein n=1 Tax=uncultured Jatrophihabitans sp. TaxID=1610747 RepID=UPI0035CBDC79
MQDDNAELVKLVQEQGREILAEGHGLLVASFRPAVRAVCDHLMTEYAAVTFVPLALYSPPAEAVERPKVALSSGQSSLISDAADALIRALSARGGRVRKSDIRGILVMQDAKFDKSNGGVAAQTGFMTIVVNHLIRRNQVRLINTQENDVNPWVELVSDVSTHVRAAAAAQETDGNLAPRDSYRRTSDDLIRELREASLGPFQDVRAKVYEEMASVLADAKEEPVFVRELVKHSISAVRTEMDEYLNGRGKPYPWSKVRVLITKLLSSAKVLLVTPDGEATAFSWTDGDIAVSGLIDEFREALDSVLLLHLLRNKQTLWLDQLAELSGALYNSRRDDAIDRGMALISYCTRAGIVRRTAHSDVEIEACVEAI